MRKIFLLTLLLIGCECEDQLFHDNLVRSINNEQARLDSLSNVIQRGGITDDDFGNTGRELWQTAHRLEFYKQHLEDMKKNSKCL